MFRGINLFCSWLPVVIPVSGLLSAGNIQFISPAFPGTEKKYEIELNNDAEIP